MTLETAEKMLKYFESKGMIAEAEDMRKNIAFKKAKLGIKETVEKPKKVEKNPKK